MMRPEMESKLDIRELLKDDLMDATEETKDEYEALWNC